MFWICLIVLFARKAQDDDSSSQWYPHFRPVSFAPGAYASQMLADFGADVIKIEEPGSGDYGRFMPPQGAGGMSLYFLAINRNKRSMTLNLKTPDGREIFLRLVKQADVVLESFRPGVLERLGLGYEQLKEVNPRLVYCAITG